MPKLQMAETGFVQMIDGKQERVGIIAIITSRPEHVEGGRPFVKNAPLRCRKSA